VNNPNNRVQIDQLQNRYGGGDINALNYKFKEGYRIDYSPYDMYLNVSVHELMEYKLFKPRSIKINDIEFGGVYSRGCGNLKYSSEYINWSNNISDDVEIFTDRMLANVDNSTAKCKIAWLIEPIAFNHKSMITLRNKDKFNYILTHEEVLLIITRFFTYPMVLVG
jgi:hypothetical protein